MASSILGAFEGVKTKKKNKDDIQYIYYKDIRSAPKTEILVILKNLQKILLKTA